MDFVWRHKGALTVTAALTAFLADPEPFLVGAADITKTVAENTVKPIAEVPGQVASGAARQINWTVAVVSASCVIGVLVPMRMWLKYRRSPLAAQMRQAAEP